MCIIRTISLIIRKVLCKIYRTYLNVKLNLKGLGSKNKLKKEEQVILECHRKTNQILEEYLTALVLKTTWLNQ